MQIALHVLIVQDSYRRTPKAFVLQNSSKELAYALHSGSLFPWGR